MILLCLIFLISYSIARAFWCWFFVLSLTIPFNISAFQITQIRLCLDFLLNPKILYIHFSMPDDVFKNIFLYYELFFVLAYFISSFTVCDVVSEIAETRHVTRFTQDSFQLYVILIYYLRPEITGRYGLDPCLEIFVRYKFSLNST